MKNAVLTEKSASSTQSSGWHFIVLQNAARGLAFFPPLTSHLLRASLMVQGQVRATAVSSPQLILLAARGQWDG